MADFRVLLHVHLSLVIHVVEVLSDPWFRALALGICGGSSRGDVAGGQAVQNGQTSAASNRSPEDPHGSTRVQRKDMICNKPRNNRTALVFSQILYHDV